MLLFFERIYRSWKMREMKSFLLLSPLLLTLLQNERNEWYNYQGKKKRKKEIYFKNLFQKKNIHCNIREIRCSIDSNKLIHAINLVYITWKIHVST